ncbi:MAG: hypothetical protein U1E05_01615 [Patescibacteria group bacterium]|nr:hypothetical protein [Patescibacteria group bacterium]
MRLLDLLAMLAGVLLSAGATSVQAEGDTVRQEAIAPEELVGTWVGENDDIRLRITFSRTGDAKLQERHERCTISAQLKCVPEPKPGAMGLRLDYRILATEEEHSEIIARVERDEKGHLTASILPVAVQIEGDFRAVAGLPIRKQPVEKE